MNEHVSGSWAAVIYALVSIIFIFNPAVAADIDQEQSTIDSTAGVQLAIGGASEQKLAQIVTAGISGVLAEVHLPVNCSSSALVVEIQGVELGWPNGTVLATETVEGHDLSSIDPGSVEFSVLVFKLPTHFIQGDQFAIVLSTSGQCGMKPGPVGDPYAGGDGYYDARPNQPGWVRLRNRFDLPFKTVVLATDPGFLHFDGRVWNEHGKFVARYNLDFRLPESSGGVLPTAEVIELELQGDLNPDGSEGSAFVISIPMGSLIDGQIGNLNGGWHWAFNPPGLRISQVHQSFVWDFPVGVRPSNVMGKNNLFVLFRPPEARKVGQIFMRLVIYDNRAELDEATPKLANLLAGNPALRIGRYEWKSQIQTVRFGSKSGWRDWLSDL